ncbi:hypothetical protein [Fulvivirga imtechensis]|nr:hypothetical protein [Fulvivirga imtechensis]
MSITYKSIEKMKELSLEKMENVEGGGCGVATQVVLGFWASGIGYAFGAVSGGIGFVAGMVATGAVIAVCEYY